MLACAHVSLIERGEPDAAGPDSTMEPTAKRKRFCLLSAEEIQGVIEGEDSCFCGWNILLPREIEIFADTFYFVPRGERERTLKYHPAHLGQPSVPANHEK